VNRSALKPISLRSQISDILRAQITSGELAPDEIYSAVALAERLGVSATPVREAMLDLAASGLVEPVRNRGFRILTVSPADLDEILTLRLWLEVPAVERVIELAGDEEIKGLRPMAEQVVAAAERREAAAFVLADTAFHEALLGLTRNRRLVRTVMGLRDQTRLLGIERLSRSGELGASAAEHLEILDALVDRDAETARKLMAAHLRHTRGIWAADEEAELAVPEPARADTA
jgi:DNA-binding GntR family transcriptional regulator